MSELQTEAVISIKPLEWFDLRLSERSIREGAHSILGTYTCGAYSDGGFYYVVPVAEDEERQDQDAASLADAKAAAQADFERRIRSVLTSPSPHKP